MIEQIILREAKQRGEHKPDRHKGGAKQILSPEQEAKIYKEYVETDATQTALAEKYCVSEQTIYRAIKKCRLDNGDQIKPRRSRSTMTLSDEQIAELGKRRDAGESTEDLAKEAGVTVNVLRMHIRRVCGPSKYAKRAQLDAQERAEIVQEYKSGMTYRELVKKHHTNTHRISDILREAGILKQGGDREKDVISDKLVTKSEFPVLMQWLNENAMSMHGLAEQIGCKSSRIYAWLVYGNSGAIPKWAIDGILDLTGMSYAELFAKSAEQLTDTGAMVDQTPRIRALEAELANCKAEMKLAAQRISAILEAHGYEA